MARCRSCNTFIMGIGAECPKCQLNAELGELLARFDADSPRDGDNLRIMEIEGELEAMAEQEEEDEIIARWNP